ncbi:MAG TPA: protein kinase, partial [Pirellulales bacterium]|nr:protein kinase [Pirellulales bacterium]
VWVALDTNTGRQVAIKFFAHRGGLDWALLSREVEKLVFLSADRYVVQLLDVGWNAEPPYYVMEYVEHGSLEDLLRREGRLRVDQAVALFRDVAVGLLHAHGKGVLHCDLKPANVLLDQDSQPRLADFGQSRLSHEQTPALGTLFYMAPEQADPAAIPDVRWDVYALGALFYSMLTGAPPHRSEAAVTEIESATGLDDRLARYRKLIEQSPPAARHRQVPGVDRALAEIIDRCLALNRDQRFANVQAVLDALAARQVRRARRPLVLLGAIGPAAVLLLISLFAWWSFDLMVSEADDSLQEKLEESNSYAAKLVAEKVTNELETRYAAVEEIAASSRFQAILEGALDDPDLAQLRTQFAGLDLPEDEREARRKEFVELPARQALQRRLEDLRSEESETLTGDWFVTDSAGVELARAPADNTIGSDCAWRSWFSGAEEDGVPGWRPKAGEHIAKTQLSSVFLNPTDNRWCVAVSTPILKESEHGANEPAEFLGVIGMTFEVGTLVATDPEGRAMLVDFRDGGKGGLILQHPLFERLIKAHQGKIPDRFLDYRVDVKQLPEDRQERRNYVDPLGVDPEGQDYRNRSLASRAIVGIRTGNTGWVVIVQESYERAIGSTLDNLRRTAWDKGLLAMALIAAISTAVWGFVIRALWTRPT